VSAVLPSGLVTALRTLTIVPVPGDEAKSLASALPWFPIVGLLIGGAQWALVVALGPAFAGWPAGLGVLAMILAVVVTGALHLDGLADWADGLGARGDRERALRIMKDPLTGAFGVVALALLIVAKVVVLSRLVELDAAAFIAVAAIASRTMTTELAVGLPYARAEGGTGAPMVREAKRSHRVQAWVAGVALVVLLGGRFGLLALAGAAVVAAWLGSSCRRRLGGVTGDVRGASNELTELAAMMVCAAALAP